MKQECGGVRFFAETQKSEKLRLVGKLFASVFLMGMICFLLSAVTYAGQITLAWDETAGAAGYKVSIGTTPGNYLQTVDVANVTSYTLDNLTEGQAYYFVAHAYDSSGNTSGYSNEIAKIIPVTTFSIMATAYSNGAITAINNPNVGQAVTESSTISTVQVEKGANQIFAITPNQGYKVANVTVDDVSVGEVSSYTFNNVIANHTIAASFTQTTLPVTSYTINATVGTKGGTISSYGTTTVAAGSNKTYSITASQGYKIKYVLVDGVSVGAVSSYTFSSVIANHAIIAYFTKSR